MIENPTDRRIIWNANLEFQVKNVDESTKDISNLCAKYEAFISRMNLSSTNYQISNNITIRVNNENFNKLINDLKGTSTFIRRVEIMCGFAGIIDLNHLDINGDLSRRMRSALKILYPRGPDQNGVATDEYSYLDLPKQWL